MNEKKLITNDELMKELLTNSEIEQIENEVLAEVKQWGGKRKNAGRKAQNGDVLSINKRLSKKETEFIDYARSHNLNYDDLMQG